jgi:hypothetical protein
MSPRELAPVALARAPGIKTPARAQEADMLCHRDWTLGTRPKRASGVPKPRCSLSRERDAAADAFLPRGSSTHSYPASRPPSPACHRHAGRLRRPDPGELLRGPARTVPRDRRSGPPARDHETVMGIERKLGVEFIGTFFLVLTVGMAVATAGALAPLANGAVLMVTAAGLRWPRRVAAPRRPDPARSAFSPGASR